MKFQLAWLGLAGLGLAWLGLALDAIWIFEYDLIPESVLVTLTC